MKDQDITNEEILENAEADFDSFLARREFSNCEAVIDNLRDMKKFEKGIELAKRLAAAHMRVPESFREETVPELTEFNDALTGLRDALVDLKEDVIF